MDQMKRVHVSLFCLREKPRIVTSLLTPSLPFLHHLCLYFTPPILHNQLHCRKTTKTTLETFYNPFPTQPWEGGIHTVMLNQ